MLVRPYGGWTAMQIATGSVAVGMQYIIKDLEPGVTPPEYVGMSNRLFPRLLTATKQRGSPSHRRWWREPLYEWATRPP